MAIQFVLTLGGGWIAWSPSTWLFALGSYFVVGLVLNLVFSESANREAKRFGDAKADKETLEIINYVAVAFAAVPVLWIFGTNLDWDKSYFCHNYYVKDDHIWNLSTLLDGVTPGDYARIYMQVAEESCLRDPEAYFSDGSLVLNKYLYYIAWVYSLILAGFSLFMLYMFMKESSGTPDSNSAVAFETLPRWERDSILDVNDSEMIDCMEEILRHMKAATRKTEAKKLVSDFEHWTPGETVYNGRNDYSSLPKNELRNMSNMYREVIKMLPSLYSPKEIEKGTMERRSSKLKARLQIIESEL